MITIGQLAEYAGVSIRTIRVYHAKGLLAEPPRDASGYRRYGAQDLLEVVKIRALSEAGLSLATIARIAAGPEDEVRAAAATAEVDVTARIERLVDVRARLQAVAGGVNPFLPAAVQEHLGRLGGLGFSERWIAIERDLWILAFATDPEAAAGYFADQAESQEDPALGQLYLECDRAFDLAPDDPALADLADRIVTASVERYSSEVLREQLAEATLPQLVQSSVNANSPAWERLDALIRSGLSRRVNP
ncbi:MerR family transcriptional regulator [Kribbella sp. WER1]